MTSIRQCKGGEHSKYTQEECACEVNIVYWLLFPFHFSHFHYLNYQSNHLIKIIF